MSEQPSNDEQRWLDRTREQLDRAEDEIDHVTLGRLRAVRREALQRVHRPVWQRWLWQPRIAAVAASLLVAVVTVQSWRGSEPQPTPDPVLAALEDLPLLTASEDFEMLENLDFYLWLEEADIG